MKKILRKLIIGLVLLFSLIDVAQAADSLSIPVSCSIPEIPGINAPLNTEAEVTAVEKNTALQEEAGTQNITMRQTSTLTETQKEIRLTKKETSSLVIETVYTR